MIIPNLDPSSYLFIVPFIYIYPSPYVISISSVKLSLRPCTAGNTLRINSMLTAKIDATFRAVFILHHLISP